MYPGIWVNGFFFFFGFLLFVISCFSIVCPITLTLQIKGVRTFQISSRFANENFWYKYEKKYFTYTCHVSAAEMTIIIITMVVDLKQKEYGNQYKTYTTYLSA